MRFESELSAKSHSLRFGNLPVVPGNPEEMGFRRRKVTVRVCPEEHIGSCFTTTLFLNNEATVRIVSCFATFDFSVLYIIVGLNS